ncbi:MAG: pitrilysin family protein [Pyrinomonadaceae bacterium]
MKKTIVSLYLLAVLSLGVFAQETPTADAAKPVVQDNDAVFYNKTLKNGLEVIVLPDNSIPLVTVELAVRNGSFTEPIEYNGLSHLFEHMIFKPNKAVGVLRCRIFLNGGNTQAYKADNCAERLKLSQTIGDVSYLFNIGEMGLAYNGTTREEIVNYYYTTTRPFYPVAVKLLNDSVRFPEFDPQELENEKQVVIGELDRNEGTPGYYLSNMLSEKLFYKYPTRKKPAGTRQTVSSATVAKMQTIKDRYYVPNNSAVIVTGDVVPDEVFKLVDAIMGSWEKRSKAPFDEFPLVEHPPLEKSEGAFVENDDVNSVIIQIGWQGPSIGKDNDATYAADVFSFILSQPDSKFSKALIDSRLAANVDLTYYTQRNVGPITMTLVTSQEKAKAALQEAYKQVALFDKPGFFSDQELENSKTILESRDLFEREKLSEYAHTLGFWWSSTGIDYFRTYHKNLRAVSRDDINRYVQTYIKGKPHVTVALLSSADRAKLNLTENDLVGGSE